MLDPQQKDFYQQHGYLVLPRFFLASEMDVLRHAALEIVEEFDPDSTSAIFTTKDHGITRDEYFLDSADKVRCFFEEEAFNEAGILAQDKHLSINKIGHALHQLHPVFKSFSRDARICRLAEELGVTKPQIHQSMYIFKQPHIGGEVMWHQDASFFRTDPISVTTFWFAIEDATVANGCLQVPDRPVDFPLREQFIRHPDDETEMRLLTEVDWPELKDSRPLELEKGGIVVFTGLLPHFSAPNRSEKSRHALTLHITSADTTYAKENWIQAAPAKLYEH